MFANVLSGRFLHSVFDFDRIGDAIVLVNPFDRFGPVFDVVSAVDALIELELKAVGRLGDGIRRRIDRPGTFHRLAARIHLNFIHFEGSID
ncbi:hypothetical protein D3C76_911580 [compost metagenome]